MRRALLALALLCAGCGGHPKRAGLEGIEDALAGAGLHVEGFADSEPRALAATRCRAGRIERILALLCSYATDDAVRHGRRAAEAFLGDAPTGVVLERPGAERALLVLADRDRADRSGRALQKIARAFRADGAKR